MSITVARYDDVFDDVPAEIHAFDTEADALAWLNDQTEGTLNLQLIAG